MDAPRTASASVSASDPKSHSPVLSARGTPTDQYEAVPRKRGRAEDSEAETLAALATRCEAARKRSRKAYLTYHKARRAVNQAELEKKRAEKDLAKCKQAELLAEGKEIVLLAPPEEPYMKLVEEWTVGLEVGTELMRSPIGYSDFKPVPVDRSCTMRRDETGLFTFAGLEYHNIVGDVQDWAQGAWSCIEPEELWRQIQFQTNTAFGFSDSTAHDTGIATITLTLFKVRATKEALQEVSEQAEIIDLTAEGDQEEGEASGEDRMSIASEGV